MRKLAIYGVLGYVALMGLLATPIGVSAQQTVRNITILAGWDTPAENDPNPTNAVTTWSLNGCWDGSAWDRCPTSTGGAGAVDANTTRVIIANDDDVSDMATLLEAQLVAHDAADAGNPLKVGAFGETAVSGRTMAADGDRVDLVAGVDGVLIVRPHANLEDLVQERTTNTDGASTAFASGLAAPGAGIKLYLTSCTLANSSASFITVDLRDGAAGSVVWTIPVSATGGAIDDFGGSPLEFTANTAVAFDASAATTTLTISCKGFKSKL